MNRFAFIAALAVALISAASLAPMSPAAAKDPNVFVGTVDHVSTGNIKVSGGGQSLSFLLVPRFNQVFSGDGKTTKQMTDIHNGDYVKVFYDQKALGARHADKIFLLKSSGRAMNSQKS
ncbi:MAG TPA: hypothetical protein VN603_02475 [Candidatus Acidoferrales bacterium]|jgi:hypothetical protein|nr:hypothetical protein [Candidatus Acidoferrales bacterium]